MDTVRNTFIEQIPGDEGIPLPTVRPNWTLHDNSLKKVMNVIMADNVPRTRTTDVNGVAVPQHFHGMMDFVAFDEIVVGMKIGLNIFQLRGFRQAAYFMPPEGSSEFPAIALGEEMRHAPGNDDSRVGRLVNQVVRHTVFTALPDEDPG